MNEENLAQIGAAYKGSIHFYDEPANKLEQI